MQWFTDQKISTKLIAVFLLMSAIVAFVGYRGVQNMGALQSELDEFYKDDLQATGAIGKVAAAYQHSRVARMEMILETGSPQYSEFAGKFRADLQTIDEQLEIFSKSNLNVEQKKVLDDLKPDLRVLQENAANLPRMLEDTTVPVETRKTQGWALMMSSTTRDAASKIREKLQRLVELTNDKAAAMKNASDARNVRQTQVFLSIIIASVVLAFLIGFLISRSITAPLASLVYWMGQVAKGDLRIPELDTTRKDEIGIVSGTLVATVKAQRAMIGEMKQSSNQVATSADEISASSVQIAKGAENQSTATDETSSTMVEMATQIDQVAKSAQTLAANVDETSSSIQEMGASVEQVAKNADTLLASVEETSATIDQMTTSIRAVAGKVKVVDEASKNAARVAQEGGGELSNVINGIGTSSKDIGKIVRIIEEIADQTNLLALNAAIEAARAGDAGKGFAVVAEEVKRLAERSMNSTREISNFVQAVQRDVSQAVELTRSVLKQIVDSVSNSSVLVAEVYSAAQEQSNGAQQILKTSSNMQNVTRQLATGAKEQANGAREIMKAVETMNRQTQQVADATSEQKKGGDMVVRAVEQIAHVSQQNLTATEQLSKATLGLAKEAERMQRLAEQFVM